MPDKDWLVNEIHDGIMDVIDTSGWDKKEWDEFYAKCQMVAATIREKIEKRRPKRDRTDLGYICDNNRNIALADYDNALGIE